MRILARLFAGNDIPNGNRVIVAAHPDDETFGVGGLLAATSLSARGATQQTPRVSVIFLTSGGSSHAGCCDISSDELTSRREDTARRAAGILGIAKENLHFMRLPDGKLPHEGMPGFAEASSRLAKILSAVRPDQIFTHHSNDGHPDHTAADALTRAALRENGSNTDLFRYCVWYWFSVPLRKAFAVNWRQAILLDIQTGYPKKKEAIDEYLRDLAPCGNPYCGILPHPFLVAFTWPKELFFRVPRTEW